MLWRKKESQLGNSWHLPTKSDDRNPWLPCCDTVWLILLMLILIFANVNYGYCCGECPCRLRYRISFHGCVVKRLRKTAGQGMSQQQHDSTALAAVTMISSSSSCQQQWLNERWKYVLLSLSMCFRNGTSAAHGLF